jgi:hypothetical protein
VVFVPPLTLLCIGAAVSREPTARRKVWGALLAGLSPLVVAGFWYGRNMWMTGNPLYPLHLEAFGRVWLEGWYGPEVMPMSQYYLPVTEWRALIDTLHAVTDARLAPFWLAAMLGAWAWRRRESHPLDRCVWLLSALSTLNIALYWLAIPYRTQQRFMLQALGLAAVPLSRLFERSRILTALGVMLLAIHLVTDQTWLVAAPGTEPPWDLSPMVPNSFTGLLKIPHDPATVLALLADPAGRLGLAAAVGLGMLAIASALGWSKVKGLAAPAPLALALLGTAGLVGLHAAAVSPWDGDVRSRFYARFPDYYKGWIETERLAGIEGSRIAYAGTNLPYYLFGTGLRNEVQYVNINANRSWLPHDYHRAATLAKGAAATWDHPRPGWDRIEADYDAWLANLRAEGVSLLVVTRANPVEGPLNIADAEGFPIERVWAEAHPERFRCIYGPMQGDPLYRLYRLVPPDAGPGPPPAR